MKRILPVVVALALAAIACSRNTGPDEAVAEARREEDEVLTTIDVSEEEPMASATRRPNSTATFTPTSTSTLTPTSTSTSTPTPTPTIEVETGIPEDQKPEQVRMPGGAPQDINRGLGVTYGGGLPNPCLQARSNEIFGYNNIAPDVRIPNGGRTTLHPLNFRLYEKNFVDTTDIYVCAGSDVSVSRAYSVAPDGREHGARIVIDHRDDTVRIYPPIELYTEPGKWTLNAHLSPPFVMEIEVPNPQAPYMVQDRREGSFQGIGFTPSEQTLIVAIFTDALRTDSGGDTIYGLDYETLDWRVSAAGYVGPSPVPERNGRPADLLFIVSESGDVAGYGADRSGPGIIYQTRLTYPNGEDILEEDFFNMLYEAAWPVSGQVQCPGFLPSRLEVGQRARVIPGRTNRLRSEQGVNHVQVGEIPAGGAFTVLDGPACVEGIAWWLVDYSGQVGWTAEGEGGTYWLEPDL